MGPDHRMGQSALIEPDTIGNCFQNCDIREFTQTDESIPAAIIPDGENSLLSNFYHHSSQFISTSSESVCISCIVT